jgi:hypothetical protein
MDSDRRQKIVGSFIVVYLMKGKQVYFPIFPNFRVRFIMSLDYFETQSSVTADQVNDVPEGMQRSRYVEVA